MLGITRALDDPQKKDLDPITILILQKDLRSDHDPQKDPFNKSHRTIIFCPSHGMEGDTLWHRSVHLQQPGWNSLRI